MIRLLTFIFFIFWFLPSKGQYAFNVAFDNDKKQDSAWDIIQTKDGGFVTVGGTSYLSPLSGPDSLLILKQRPDGETQWKLVLNNALVHTCARGVTENHDGSIMVTGQASNSDGDAFLLKISAGGQVLWNTNYTLPGHQVSWRVKQARDGGFVMAGYNNTALGVKAWLCKTDSLGNLQWEYSYSSVSGGRLYAVEHSHDGGYILSGEAYPSSGPRKMLLIKVDSLGIQQWLSVYNGPLNANYRGHGVVSTFDGGYLVAGGSYTISTTKGYIIKVDSIGNTQWTYQNLGGLHNSFQYPVQLADSSYVITGNYRVIANDGDGSLTKLSPQGNLIWERTYFHGAGFDEYFYSITTCADGGFAMGGMIINMLDPPQKTDFWILKTDACGNTVGDTLNPVAAMSLINGAGINSNTYNFTNQSSGHCGQLWHFGDGDSTFAANPQHTYQPGTYTVMLVAFAGTYTDTVYQQITIMPCGTFPGDTLLPVAAMQVTPGSINGTFNLSSQSTEYCSLLWLFGDGNTSTSQSLQHQYQQSGTYTITHIAIKGNLADTITQQVSVQYACNMAPADNLEPTAAMVVNLGGQPGTYNFTSQSTEYCSLLWYFGDGDSSTVANPQHTYQQSGTYTVMHIALAGLKADTVTQQVSVVLGAEQTLNTVPVQLYPNPNNGEFIIAFETQPEQGNLEIYEILGKLVHSEPVVAGSAGMQLSLPYLTRGIYHSRLVWKGKSGVVRFVKQ